MAPTYQPTHYDISIAPIFTKDGSEHKYEGLTDAEKNGFGGGKNEFRFIADTLRKHFGTDLHFDMREDRAIIATLSSAQMKILREIYEDTVDFPVKYGRSRLKFEIGTYTYDAPQCEGTIMCECNDCDNDYF
jgi:hypothetical protein